MTLSPEALAHRARQGGGARWDADAAPAADLLLARRGTAHFARCLGTTGDDALTGAIAARVAEVGYHARAMAEALGALRTGGVAEPWGLEAATRRAASLPPRALRSLVHHASTHLDVEWRDLTDALWDCPVTVFGKTALARDTPRQRARLVWHATLSLGGKPQDLPEAIRA